MYSKYEAQLEALLALASIISRLAATTTESLPAEGAGNFETTATIFCIASSGSRVGDGGPSTIHEHKIAIDTPEAQLKE